MSSVDLNPNRNKELVQTTEDGNGGCKEEENKEENQGITDTASHLFLCGDTKRFPHNQRRVNSLCILKRSARVRGFLRV